MKLQENAGNACFCDFRLFLLLLSIKYRYMYALLIFYYFSVLYWLIPYCTFIVFPQLQDFFLCNLQSFSNNPSFQMTSSFSYYSSSLNPVILLLLLDISTFFATFKTQLDNILRQNLKKSLDSYIFLHPPWLLKL